MTQRIIGRVMVVISLLFIHNIGFCGFNWINNQDSIVLFNNCAQSIDFAYNNEFDDRIVFKIPGNSVYKIYSQIPVFLIQTNKNQNFYLLNLNEKISITLDSFGNAIFNSGGNQERNNELNFSCFMNEQLPKLNFWNISQQIQKLKNQNYLKLDSLLKHEFKTKLEFLKKYKMSTNISTSYVNYINAFFISHFLGAQLFFIGIERKNEIPKSYENYLASLRAQIFDDLDTHNVWIRKLQFNYIKFLYRQYDSCGSYRDSLYSSAALLLKGNEKNDLQFFIVKDELNKNIESKKWFIQDFLGQNNSYNRYVNDLIERNSIIGERSAKSVFINLSRSKLDFDSLISTYKGHVIYIDIWASWCLPCRKEMLAEKKIITSYLNKPISFVYISIDKDLETWEIACKNENLITNSYWLPNFDQSDFKKRYGISTIPHYVLISETGKVIDRNAPYPSDPALLKLFGKVLTDNN